MALAMLFGYISMGLLLAAFLRSQFKYLQRLFFPSCILAGFILLLLGLVYSVLSIYPPPEQKALSIFCWPRCLPPWACGVLL